MDAPWRTAAAARIEQYRKGDLRVRVLGYDSAHQDHYAATTEYLLANGAPLSGLGMQGHFGDAPTGIPRLEVVLDRFAAYGLPIRITEFDVNTTDEALQADYLRDAFTMFFSHPAVVGVQQWGFWEGAHWLPDAALYRLDWSEKPNGAAYRQLVLGDWWTNADLTTDAGGETAVRGFRGDYQVTVVDGGTTVHAATLGAATDLVLVHVPGAGGSRTVRLEVAGGAVERAWRIRQGSLDGTSAVAPVLVTAGLQGDADATFTPVAGPVAIQ